MRKTQLPGCFWASGAHTWAPSCASHSPSCKGIQPWALFALFKDLHEWNCCWWNLKELLRLLFVSAENAVNSRMRHLCPSAKGGGDSPPDSPSPHDGRRLSDVGVLMKEHVCGKSYLLLLNDPATERSTPAEVQQGRQT